MSLDRERDSLDVRPMLADDLDSADAIMRLAFGTASRPSRPGEHVRRQRHRAHAVPCSPGLRMGRRARRRASSVRCSRRAGARSASSARCRSDPDHWDRGIGGRLLQPVLDAFTELGRPAGRALHLRGESQAPRPLPEARLLARRADGRDDQGGRSAVARRVRARSRTSAARARSASSRRSAR